MADSILYREDLNLPSMIKDNDYGLKALQYSSFLDMVLSREPLLLRGAFLGPLCLKWVKCGFSQADRFRSVVGESGSTRLGGPELGVHRTILAALETNANSQEQTFAAPS